MRRSLVLGVLFLALGLSDSALAGVVVTSTQTRPGASQPTPMTAYVEPDRLKVIQPPNTIIYRADLDRLWVIDTQRNTYVEMTAENVRAVGGQMTRGAAQLGAAQAQLQAQLSLLPPEQRAMLEQMMGGRGLAGVLGGGAPARLPQIAFSKAGNSKTVAGWNCDEYRKTANGQAEADLCIAPISAAGLSTADFQVLERFVAFIQPVASSPMVPRMDYLDWDAMNKAIGFAGIPLDTTIYVGGKPDVQNTVNKIERVSIPNTSFELPPGLTKQGMGGLLR